MTTIGLLSDTHGFLDPGVVSFLASCNQIWHAGDIGSVAVLEELKKMKPTLAVAGNIDGADIRVLCREVLVFEVEELKVVMIHIGGYPGRYSAAARQLIAREKPGLFVCGHSHILKIIYDPGKEVLTVNPGAAGRSGFHQFITALRFKIDGKRIFDMEVFEKTRV